MLWYHVKHQLLLNKMQLFFGCNKLTWKRKSLAKTPLILTLVTHLSIKGLLEPAHSSQWTKMLTV